MKTAIVADNQNIYDIALQYYGNVEAAFEIRRNNPALRNDPNTLNAIGVDSVTDLGFYLDVAVAPGSSILIDTDSKLYNTKVVKELNKSITTYQICEQ